jgi:CheY-like chemotaxis protein
MTPAEAPLLTFLIAEDTSSVRDFIVRTLRAPNRHILEAQDGQQALDVLTRQKIDLLITDIVMPGVDGIALTLKALRLYPDLKIIMISGYPNERLRAHNLEALAHQILAKPFSLEELQEAVENLVETR